MITIPSITIQYESHLVGLVYVRRINDSVKISFRLPFHHRRGHL